MWAFDFCNCQKKKLHMIRMVMEFLGASSFPLNKLVVSWNWFQMHMTSFKSGIKNAATVMVEYHHVWMQNSWLRDSGRGGTLEVEILATILWIMLPPIRKKLHMKIMSWLLSTWRRNSSFWVLHAVLCTFYGIFDLMFPPAFCNSVRAHVSF